MTRSLVCYRSLRNWKYQVTSRCRFETPIEGFDIPGQLVSLNPKGLLTIEMGYCWDGASGPTIDTQDSQAASLAHDALYQLMRLELLPQYVKPLADQVLHDVFTQDAVRMNKGQGVMGWIRRKLARPRADVWKLGVELFASGCCKPGTEKPEKIICV
jgi:hypothetical protein